MIPTLTMNNQIVKSFLFYAALLVGKTLFMSVLTALWRYKKRILISPEDRGMLRGGKSGVKDEDIERIRRAHQNDLENITMFLATGLIYSFTEPDPFVAINLFRLYTLCRFLHTFVYAIVVIRQPARVTVWTIAYLINWYMVYVSVKYFAAK